MRRIALVLATVSTLAVSAAPAYSAVRPPSGAKPAWTKEAAFGRTHEWAVHDWGNAAEWPYECRGPYENGHGKTQWACIGNFNNGSEEFEYWQVNIDAYGAQTYATLFF